MNRKTMSLLSDLPPATRRRFLQGLGVALAAPAVPPALRYAVNEVLVGEAYAQSAGTPTFFIEVNLRDQQDLGSIFVPPGLAKNVNLQRGDCGKKVSLYHEMNALKLVGKDQYLTPDSIELEPHVGSIACIDLFELTPGNTHYHQSANRTRAPDCSMDTKMPGQIEMWTLDKPLYSFPTGTERYHCAIPTPATMHNSYQKKLNPALLNGIAFKGISRQKHAVYHCAGALPTTAELDRMTDKAAVDKKFTGKSGTPLPPGLVPTADEAELLVRVLKKVDPSFLKRRSYGQKVIDDHLGLLGEAQGRLKPPPMMPPGMNPPMTPPVNLALTAEEIAYWKTGVPEQDGNGKTIVPGGFKVIQDGDTPRKVNFQGWEQYALAWKLVQANLARSIAIECEFIDWHDTRPEGNMKAYTWCTARPLARLISNLKKAGLYNNTLIAVYTTDGSRAPSANSSGDEGKNTVILAGGMLEGKGGYYGDIEATGMETAGNCVGTGHKFIYKIPDLASGAPTGGVAMGSAREPRIKGAVLWKTVMRLLKVPETEYAQFPLVAGARTLDFLL